MSFELFIALRYLKAKRLVEIPVKGWKVETSLYLSCNSDRVRAKTQTQMTTLFRRALHQALRARA